jgi:tetratricopeptide (TPR) repeat protein
MSSSLSTTVSVLVSEVDGGSQQTLHQEDKVQHMDTDTVRRAETFKEEGNACIQNSKDFQSAIAAYTSAIALVNSNYIYFNNRAAAYTFAGEYTLAIADCDASLALQSNVRAHSRKAAALGELGQVEEALGEVAAGLLLSPDDKHSLNVQTGLQEMETQAEQLKQEGNECVQGASHDFRGAIKAYTAAISIVKTNYIYYNNRAAAYLFAGEYLLAIQDCEASLALKEGNVRALSRKAAALGEMGHLDEALVAIAQALQTCPDDKQSLHISSGLQVMQEQAERLVEQGSQHLKQHDHQQRAIQCFSEALSLAATNHRYFNHRAAAYLLAGDLERALLDCERSLSLHPSVRAHAWSATALGRLGRVEEAIAAVERGLGMSPTDEACLEIEADLLKQKVVLEDLAEQAEEKAMREGGRDMAGGEGPGGRDKGFLQGVKHMTQKVKAKIPMDYSHRCAQEDILTQQLAHARKFRRKLQYVREEKYYLHLYMHEDETMLVSLGNARRCRKERKVERLYQQRIAEEDAGVRRDLVLARERKAERYGALVASEAKDLSASQQHAREVRHWKQIIDQLALKARLAKEEKDAKRDSARWIKASIARKRQAAGMHVPPPPIPEHLLPFGEKIDLWREQIRKQLRKSWGDMTFSIEYIEEEGLCIGFDIEDERHMMEENLDFKIARYMNRLAISGILHAKKLHKRADRWRVLEDSQDGRGLSLRFYCHIPRSQAVHLKMPRVAAIDIIERTSGLYDYDLVPRATVVKQIGQTAYSRENRPPMLQDKHKKQQQQQHLHEEGRIPRGRGVPVPDVVELVELPSVQLDCRNPGFVHMTEERDNEVWGGGGRRGGGRRGGGGGYVRGRGRDRGGGRRGKGRGGERNI